MSFLIALERQTGDKHFLNERWCRNEIFKFEIKDSLKALNAERSQFGQFSQNVTEVMRFALCFGIVRHMITKTADNFHLKLFDFFRIADAMTFCDGKENEKKC